MGSNKHWLPTRLLVGTDLSPGAASALRLAQSWGSFADVPLAMMHGVAAGLTAGDEPALLVALEEHARAASGGRTPPTTQLGRGGVADSLLNEAASTPGTWLVLGSEGAGARALRRTGRLVAELARGCRYPVLVAPPRWRPAARRSAMASAGFSRVLVGLSGARRDLSLLTLGRSLSAGTSGLLMAAHSDDQADTAHYPTLLREKLAAERDATLRDFSSTFHDRVDALELALATPLHILRQGPVHQDLAGLADAQEAGLILVGSGPTASLLAGVTAVPLLVLPE